MIYGVCSKCYNRMNYTKKIFYFPFVFMSFLINMNAFEERANKWQTYNIFDLILEKIVR